MKYQYLITCLLLALIVSCGSSERVITSDGTVYELKGSKIINDGIDVAESLSEERKAEIESVLEAQRKAKIEALKRQEELDKKQKELEKVQKEAEKKRKEAEEKRKEIEKKQADLEKKLKAQEKAREAYLKAEKRLASKLERYEKLKAKGKLSPRDEEKWQKRFEGWEEDLKKAKIEMDNLNK